MKASASTSPSDPDDLSPYLGDVATPTLAVRGDRDAISSRAATKRPLRRGSEEHGSWSTRAVVLPSTGKTQRASPPTLWPAWGPWTRASSRNPFSRRPLPEAARRALCSGMPGSHDLPRRQIAGVSQLFGPIRAEGDSGHRHMQEECGAHGPDRTADTRLRKPDYTISMIVRHAPSCCTVQVSG